MLDMGFDKEVKACMDAVREQMAEKFSKLAIVLAAATTGGMLTDLVKNIMSNYVSVGFETDTDSVVQVPSAIQQLYVYIPTLYRVHYLLALLYCKRGSKIMLFVSTCQAANYLYDLVKAVDWDNYGRGGEYDEDQSAEKPKIKGRSTKYCQAYKRG